MRRFTKNIVLAAVALAMVAGCKKQETEKTPKEVELAVLVSGESLDVLEGTVTLTFTPSGTRQTLTIGDAAQKADATMFPEVNASLVTSEGQDQLDNFWSSMLVEKCSLEGLQDDAKCIITKSLKPKAGLSLTDADKYSVTLVVYYKTPGKSSFNDYSMKGIRGDRLSEWCTRHSGTTTTLEL